jgi:hypothetical protein
MLRRLLVDDPTARPVVIFGPGDLGRKAFAGEARGAKCLPLLLPLVMTRGVREAIAVGFSFVQSRAVNDQSPVDPPENTDGRLSDRKSGSRGDYQWHEMSGCFSAPSTDRIPSAQLRVEIVHVGMIGFSAQSGLSLIQPRDEQEFVT